MFMKPITAIVVAALLMTGGMATVTQVTEYGVQPLQQKNAVLTKDEAKGIALNHAGLSEDAITGIRIEYDVELGEAKWDIDFRSGDWEYDYEIHAETGAVIKSEKEYDPVKAPTSTKPAETPKTETPKTEKLTAEEAKNAALKHAGLKASQVKGLRAEYDVDDGVPQWDVEFYADGMEYDYEIHATSGKILSWDKDRDD